MLPVSHGKFKGKRSACLARAVYKLMHDQGKWEGEGCYQQVFTYPGIDGVIKLDIGDVPAAEYAIKVAPNIHNPHVPKLIKYYGNFLADRPPNWGHPPRVWVYQVEKLNPVGNEIYSITDSLSWENREDYDKYAAELIRLTNEYYGDNYKMGEAILAIRNYVKRYAARTGLKPRLDLHKGNWMRRPGTNELVLNDPIAAPNHAA